MFPTLIPKTKKLLGEQKATQLKSPAVIFMLFINLISLILIVFAVQRARCSSKGHTSRSPLGGIPSLMLKNRDKINTEVFNVSQYLTLFYKVFSIFTKTA